jgi:hypothetical protein
VTAGNINDYLRDIFGGDFTTKDFRTWHATVLAAVGLTGWKVMAELPNPVNFEAATAGIGPEQAREQFACGPDVKRHLQVAQQFVDAGFDHLVTMNAGPNPDGFIDFFARELAAPLRP